VSQKDADNGYQISRLKDSFRIKFLINYQKTIRYFNIC
jgi:hypothetical protein